MPWRTWGVPGFYELDDDQYEEIEAIIQAAEDSGVVVSGTAREALGVVDAYELELANLAIYQAWITKDLKRLCDLFDDADIRPHSRFPSIDFDSLVPNNLKLVKVDLPEEGWFALRLETGGGFETRDEEEDRADQSEAGE